MGFHDVLFPPEISRGATGGPERRTDVVVLASGHEQRNSRWADSRRRYNAGYGIKTLDQLHAVIAFFEERRGRLCAFRWRDHMDLRSCPPEQQPTAFDQPIGSGDGTTTQFQLTKAYGGLHAPWQRIITRPVPGSVTIAVDAAILSAGAQYNIDHTNGLVTFEPGHAPSDGSIVTAGFGFDVPVRFDTDRLEISLSGFRHGSIPNIPVIEVRE